MTGILLFIILYSFIGSNISVGCIFKNITGIPCAGCGSIRALTSLVKGDLLKALYYNPVTVVLFFAFVFLVIMSVVDIVLKKHYVNSILYKKLKTSEYIIIIIVFLSNWMFNIIKFSNII